MVGVVIQSPASRIYKMELLTRHLTASAAQWVTNASPEDIALAIELGIPAATAVISVREKATAAISSATAAVEDARREIENNKRRQSGANSEEISRADSGTISGKNPSLPTVAPQVVSSHARGALGESLVARALTSEFGDVSVTSHDTMSGDMSVSLSGYKILVEVKNYASGVPAREVDKFHRDLDAASAAAGLFVSLGGAQISTITRGFELAYKFCGSRVIPCAYIVSDDPRQIMVATRMLVRAISLKREHSTERLTDAHEGLAALSRARTELQIGLGEITARMVGLSCGVAAAESRLRESFEDGRQDAGVTGTTAEGVLEHISKSEGISHYSARLRGHLEEIITVISGSREGLSSDTWVLAERSITDTATGISLKLLRGSVIAHIPRVSVSHEHTLVGLREFGDAFRVTKNIEIAVDARGIDWCRRALFGTPVCR